MTGTVIDRPRSAPIDRRIRARRIAVKRREARRRLHRLLGLLAVSLVVLGAWGLTRSPLLDVDQVEVVGAARTEAAEVLERSGVVIGAPLVDVDVDAAAAEVAALPWIADVTVERGWGGTVTVSVTERTPGAIAVDASGSTWLVDGTGAVLGASSEVDGALVRIEGLDPPAVGDVIDPAQGAVALGLASRLDAAVLPVVAAIEVRADGVWIRLQPRPGEVDAEGVPRTDGGHVRVGDGRALDEQVRSIATVLDQVDLTDLVVLDVRVPSNPVVTRTVWGSVESTQDATGEEAG